MKRIIIIFLLMSVLLIASVYFIKKPITAEDFKIQMENNGYSVEDITNESDYDVEKAYSAIKEKEEYTIYFYQFSSKKVAKEFFEESANNLRRYKTNGFYSTATINLINYFVYEQKGDGNYGIVSRIDNTAIRSISSLEKGNEVNNVFIELGYMDNLETFFDNSLFIAFCVFFQLIIVVSFWKIFVKAGVPGWGSLIPLYNFYLLAKITYGNGWRVLLLLIPGANFFFAIAFFFKLAEVFNKPMWYGLGFWFLWPVFLPMLAFGNAQYVGYE